MGAQDLGVGRMGEDLGKGGTTPQYGFLNAKGTATGCWSQGCQSALQFLAPQNEGDGQQYFPNFSSFKHCFYEFCQIFKCFFQLLTFQIALTLNILCIIHGFDVHAAFFLMYIKINRAVNFPQGSCAYHLKLYLSHSL